MDLFSVLQLQLLSWVLPPLYDRNSPICLDNQITYKNSLACCFIACAYCTHAVHLQFRCTSCVIYPDNYVIVFVQFPKSLFITLEKGFWKTLFMFGKITISHPNFILISNIYSRLIKSLNIHPKFNLLGHTHKFFC